MNKNWLEEIKQNDKITALERKFPGKSCGNTECEKLCATALQIAQTMMVDPVILINEAIKQNIAPTEHCIPVLSSFTEPFFTFPCRFKFVRPDLTCVKNPSRMPPFSFTDDERKVIGKKYIADSVASKSGACKKCLENANHIFKWPEEAHLMPKLPIHLNCKCYYKDVIADDSEKILLMNLLIPIWNMYVDSKREIREFVQKTIELVADSVEAMLKASSYIAFHTALNTVKGLLDALEIRIKILTVILENIIKAIDFVITFIKLYSSSQFCVDIISALQDWAKRVQTCYNDIKVIHYSRLEMVIQQIHYLPKNPKEARSKLAEKAGWVKATNFENSYHKNKGKKNNVKYYNPKTGQEVVYESDADDAKIVTTVNNIGTFNHGSPKEWAKHLLYDVLPYYLWGNSSDDDTSLANRIIGNH